MKKILFFLLISIKAFSQGSVKISDMPAATSLTGTEIVPIVQGGINKKATVSLWPNNTIVVSSNTTAVNDAVYTVVASATFTDPTPVEGKGFTVFIRNGTGTVGGTGYSVAGTKITRIFHSGSWANYVSGGDMVLASTQTNTGLKTFLDGTLGMRNVANTFTSQFTNTNSAARTYTLPDFDGNILVAGNGGVNVMTGDLVIDAQTDKTGSIQIGNTNSPLFFYGNFKGDASAFVISTFNSAATASSGLSISPANGYIMDILSPSFQSSIRGNTLDGAIFNCLNTDSASAQISLAKNISGANNSFALYTKSTNGIVASDLRLNINGSTWTINYGSDATGGIPYRNSSGNEVRLPIGTNGQVLTVAGGIPTWAAPAGGGGGTYYAPSTLVANATDANFTATVNGVHNILDGVASANRVITIPTGANGDVMKFYNTEDTRVWSFTGETVYLADRVTVVTELLYNVPCHMERIDGRWIITN
jgi:hypothetical protein